MKAIRSFVALSGILVVSAAWSQDPAVVLSTVTALKAELGALSTRHVALGNSTEIAQGRFDTLQQELDAIEAGVNSEDPETEALSMRALAVSESLVGLRIDIGQDERNRETAARVDALNASVAQGGLDMLQHFGVGLMLATDIGGPDRVDSAAVVEGKVVVDADSNVRAGFLLEYHTWMFCEHLDFNDPAYERSTNRAGAYYYNENYRAVPMLERGDNRSSNSDESPTNNDGVSPTESQLTDPSVRKYLKQVPPCNPERRSSGLFVAVVPDAEELIDSVGVGWMWRLPDKLRLMGSRALNIGFGIMSDPNVQVLGEGYVEGMNAPVDSNGVPLPIRYRETDKTSFFFAASIELGDPRR